MRFLATADLHITERPEDEYRWSVFSFLKRAAEANRIDVILLLGDLTHDKDNHSAALVNRLVDAITSLPGRKYIISGNHDYKDTALPFFRFMRELEDVHFFTKPATVKIDGERCLFLPHTRRRRRDWRGLRFSRFKYIFLHQALRGAVLPAGYELHEKTVPTHLFSKRHTDALVLAGDIHVPQQVGRVTYCGSPHPINFGDDYQPRVLLVDGKQVSSLDRFTIRKLKLSVSSLEELREQNIQPDDRVKVTVTLNRSELADWPQIRRDVEEHLKSVDAQVCGVRLKEFVRKRLHEEQAPLTEDVQPRKILKRYCKVNKVGKSQRKAALELLKETQE
jgi:DNA repair exonuclease SbcCD nuclease subunit